MASAAVAVTRPREDEFAPYFGKYVSAVEASDALTAIQQQTGETVALLRSIAPDKAGYRYAEGKWSIAEVLGHIIDCERIFAYRALRIARGDQTPLPSFDQDAFVANANFDSRTLADLIDEFEQVRASTLTLLRYLPADAWDRRGTASNNPISLRAIAWIIAGHELSHVKILRERYLG